MTKSGRAGRHKILPPDSGATWRCVHKPGQSQIYVLDEETQRQEVIADVFAAAGYAAKALAERMVYAVTTLQQRESLIDEMAGALQICLDCDGLDWSAEHDAEIALRRALARKRR